MLYNGFTLRELDDLQLIDRVADEFESAWLEGERPSMAWHVGRVPIAKRTKVVSELTLIDIDYRQRRGETPTFLEYQREFPDCFGNADLADKAERQPEKDGSGNPAAGGQTEFQRIGRYVVLSRLPSDGQADVLLAVHPLGIQVVLKFLRDDLPQEQEALIVDEARVLANLRHPRIAHVLDLDCHEGRAFAVIGYIHGQTLDQYSQQRKLSHGEIARLMADLARILAVAHRAGVAHLDLKPRNVIIDREGAAHLIDFGAARIFNSMRDDSGSGDFLVGSAPFMSPEQAQGRLKAVNARSDIFGLGALLYYLLAGHAPFAGADAAEALSKAKAGRYTPLSLSVPSSLRKVCALAMDESPDLRQADAESLAGQLEACAVPPTNRRRTLLLAGGMLAVGLAVSVAVMSIVGDAGTIRADPQLSIKYQLDGRWTAIEEVGTHYLLAPLRLEADIPPGQWAALFQLEATGFSQLPGGRDAGNADRRLTYPAIGAVQVEGPTGNRTVLCLTSAAGAPGEAELRLLLEGTTWPTAILPDGMVVTATGKAVETLYAQRSKSLRVIEDTAADTPARVFLDIVRRNAVKRGFGFAAVTVGFRAEKVDPHSTENKPN